MNDPRIRELAANLIHYSCNVQPGENVLIESIGNEVLLVKAIIDEVYAVGGYPFVTIKDKSIDRALLMHADKEQLHLMSEYEAYRMKRMQAYIGIRSGDNIFEWSDIPSANMKLYQEYIFGKVHSRIRVPETKWVVLRYPSPSMAQLANMSTESFEKFYFDVCNLDYKKMSIAMEPLVKLMNRTEMVRITGRGTDLHFSIKNLPAIKCDGKQNIPDGEVFTAPIKDSVNGYLTYNTPAVFQGATYENIRLEFQNGKIVQATSNNTERLNNILDSDQGSRYIGEFALGLNPFINQPIKDTLFDEKIAGSFHFTPGDSYDECPNGNKSSIHWDLVCIQTPEYGGGNIYFDNVLVRADGRFVLPELENLNPENLK